MSLDARAWIAVVALAAPMGALLFACAGTLRYAEGWAYLAVFTAATVLTTLQLLREDRALLERRMRGGPFAERQPRQRLISVFTSIGFVALLAVPALDRRCAWSQLPIGIAAAGDALVALGFYLISRVYRENRFTSATIEVTEDQRVVSTGPYALVRHPMYASASLYLLGTPLALGSWWGLVPLAAMLPFRIWRLVEEERLLAQSLPGYTEYQRRVPRRLVPFLW